MSLDSVQERSGDPSSPSHSGAMRGGHDGDNGDEFPRQLMNENDGAQQASGDPRDAAQEDAEDADDGDDDDDGDDISEGDGDEETSAEDAEIEGDFTFRAVFVGLLVGVLLAFTNLYFGLQTGWISMMSLQSALLGYAIFLLPVPSFLLSFIRTLPRPLRLILDLEGRPFSPQENVVLQTTAVATGTLPLAAGLVGIIPALEQLDWILDGSHPIRLGYWSLAGWSIGICFFGVFLAAPLRKQVIVKEKLVFPSGTATAQLIALLHKIPPPRLPVPEADRDRDSVKAMDQESTLGYEDGQEGRVGQSSSRTKMKSKRTNRMKRNGQYHALPTSSSHGQKRSIESFESDDVQRRANSTTRLVRNGKTEEIREEMGRRGWFVLGWSFVASSTVTFLSLLFPVIFAIPLFDILSLPFGTSLAANWLWWFSPSLSYVGQGIIMGFSTTVSMNLGMICGWAILSPLAKHKGWAPGPVSSSTDGSRGWILWVSLAIMISESVISLIPICLSYGHKLYHEGIFPNVGYGGISKRKSSSGVTRTNQHGDEDEHCAFSDDDDETEPPERLVPMSWVSIGLASSAFLCVLFVWIIFGNEGIKPWATFIGLILACILSLLGVRALGETDLNPVSGIGKISQLLFAVLQPGNVVANIIAGGVAEAGAQQAGDLMQDLKTGALLRASPRSQFYGQLIGSFASVFISVGAYKLYTTVYVIPGPEFRVPTAAIWLNLARLLNTGHLPPYASTFMIIFGSVFALLSIIKYGAPLLTSKPPRWVKYVPSGIAFAIGFLNTPSFSLARLIGGYVAYRASRKTGETPLLVIVCASGFVLGEGIISIVGLLMTSMGGGAISCFGCGSGGGGYCSGGC